MSKDKGQGYPSRMQLHYMSFFVFTAFCLVAADALGQQDRIERVQVISDSPRELKLQVTYVYSGSHGTNADIAAWLVQSGKPLTHFRLILGRVKVGSGTTIVTVSAAHSAPRWFTSDQLVLEMATAGAGAFLRQSFWYAKTWMQPGTALPPVVGVEARAVSTLQLPSATGGNVGRSIGSDGTVELRYPDGTIKRVFQDGREEIEHPDGTRPSGGLRLYVNVQAVTPPSVPPDALHRNWLKAESDALLKIIRDLVGNDHASISNYLAKEGSTLTYYEQIDRRTKTIGFLLSP